MEEIKNWAFSICSAAVCGSMLSMLVPEKSAQKTFTSVLCIFFLCVLVSPIKNIDKLNNFDLYEIFNVESEKYIEKNEFDSISLDYVENETKKAVNNILLQNGISAKDILIKINISDDNSIDINKFVITLDRNENIYEIKEKIFKETGIEPEIIISEENADGSIK